MWNTPYLSERSMPFDPDIPEDDQRFAEAVSAEYDRGVLDEARALAAGQAEVTERAKHRARELMGAENWLRLRRRIREEDRKLIDAMAPPHGLSADYDALDGERRKVLAKAFDDLGVSRDALGQIYYDLVAASSDLAPARDHGTGFAARLAPENSIQTAGPQVKDPHAWTAFRAPFAGWQQGFRPGNNTGTFRTSWTPFINSSTGLVGHDMRVDNFDASDVDQGGGISDTQISFWYKPPIPGVLEIQIDARCDECLHQLRTYDEPGFSSQTTDQENSLMAHVIHPGVNGPSFAWMSRFHSTVSDDRTDRRRFLQIGGLFGARLRTNGSVGNDRFLEIRAGSHEVDGTITNDVGIHQFTSFRWTLQTVFVRVAP